MDKLEAMRAFTRVVTSGNYAQAARELGLTRSAVSKAVMELEHLLGARLLDRTTRKVHPTEAGLAYFARCSAVLAEIEEAENQIAGLHEAPRGLLRVNAPMSFGIAYLGDAIADFLSDYAELRIELVLNDRRIDPIDEGFDVTVRVGELADSSLIARRIATTRLALVASPKYLDRHGTPESVEELAKHNVLAYGHATLRDRLQLHRGSEMVSVAIASNLCANNGDVLRDAACSGLGIAWLPTLISGPRIKDGSLKIILPDYAQADTPIHALYAPNRYLAAKTRLFIDFLLARFANPPWD